MKAPASSRDVPLRQNGEFSPAEGRLFFEQEQGALLWDFLVSFVAARRTFLSIFGRYENRVLHHAQALGVPREHLKLPPKDLFDLFHLQRLKFLRRARLRPLRDLAEKIFADSEHEELLDVYCSHIYHEFSILSEEHRSVGRFLRIHDRRRYRTLFEEVSGYYPRRLRRIRRLFTGGLRRIETLLPDWAEHNVIVRCVYLFGDQLAQRAYGRDVTAIYSRMYPKGGALEGFLEAARNFHAASFLIRAREAAERGLDVGAELARRRPLSAAEAECLEATELLLARLDKEAGVETEAIG